ncbi:prepilin-type N-terminal cleavage/methylation domain-containing protein [Candidatus Uhrbacteria bacterium]|nr:prepilin-type N-terminal cleavage/methylation domain-containing protein [Candidatus Uhrbacteria bacterium]
MRETNKQRTDNGNGHRKGLTLLEVLLSVGLAGILLGAVSMFLAIVLNARIKQQTIVEVEEQGVQMMELISSSVRSASSITTPIVGNSASNVVLAGSDAITVEPINGTLWYTKGVASPLAMHNSNVIISNAQFSNRSRAQTPGTIQIQFTLSRVNREGRNEYNYSQTFYGSASIR